MSNGSYSQQEMTDIVKRIGATHADLSLVLVVDDYPEARHFDIGFITKMHPLIAMHVLADTIMNLINECDSEDQESIVELMGPLLGRLVAITENLEGHK